MDHMNWLDQLRDWNWNMMDLWHHWTATAMYYLDTVGWPAYVGLALFVIFLGLSFDLTHQWTSMILARTWGALFYVIMTFAGLILSWLYLLINRFIVARIRDSVRLFRDYRRQRNS